MQKCEYCNKSFIKGDSVDIGVGLMQIMDNYPNCDCYETTYCEETDSFMTLGELRERSFS